MVGCYLLEWFLGRIWALRIRESCIRMESDLGSENKTRVWIRGFIDFTLVRFSEGKNKIDDSLC